MCRFRGESRVLVCLRSVLTENVILTRFRVIRPRATFRVRYCSMCRFRGQNARFSVPTICTYRKCYFDAIPSHKVEIDISCEILLNVSLSSRNAHFSLPMNCTLRNCYFEAIPSHKVEIDISCEILLNVSLSSENACFRLLMICTRGKCYLQRFRVISRDRHFM